MEKIIGLIGVGFCLGIGFWLAKKATEPLDNWLAKRDGENYLQHAERIREMYKQRADQQSKKEVS